MIAPDMLFDRVASDEQIARTVEALTANGFRVLVASDGEQARKLFFESLPDGAQVHMGASRTLEPLGIVEEVEKSGRFDAVRPKVRSMDRQTQAAEMRRLGASPDYMAGSVHAVTEDGHTLIASASGSQLGPYVSGAGQVIWVVGAQKLVRDLNEGFLRIDEHVFPLENERAQKAYGMNSSLNKILIVNKERPDRITIILVKENLGF